MKNLLTFLLIFLFSLSCISKEVEKLPEIPWKAIVETYNPEYINLWRNDINIKLFGNYSSGDSLMIENAIEKLNTLTQSIQLKLTNLERGNLEIYFLDSTNYSKYDYFISLTRDQKAQWSYSNIKQEDGISLFTQALNMEQISVKFRQNYLINVLAFALYPVFWRDNKYYEQKIRNENVDESIFRAISAEEREKLFYLEMQEFDKNLLTTVYAIGFNEKLKIAQRQYKPFITIRKWLQSNPYVFLLLPVGIILFLLLPLYIRICRKIANKFNSRIIGFNINGLIGISIVIVLGYFYFTLAYGLKWEHLRFQPFKVMLTSIAASLVIGLLTINIIRFVEILIHRNTHIKSAKIVLIFLSTGVLPFIAILAFSAFVLKGKFSAQEITFLSYIFLGGLIIASFRALISYFIFKEKEMILENETKLSKLRELKSKAELNALHSRINPHFLYNSLNSIAGLAHENADQTEHMALSLSKLFRYSINKEQSDWTTFKEELEMVRIYLDVEKVRFGERLNYAVEMSKELEEHKIPRFVIQPLVENAVKHGISKLVEGGEIKVSITKEGGSIFIIVSDSGQPFPADLTAGFGLQSIYDKLEILYSNRFEMSFLNAPVKQVKLKLE
jgi:hypothetical protein